MYIKRYIYENIEVITLSLIYFIYKIFKFSKKLEL